jgi:hypothetical protein
MAEPKYTLVRHSAWTAAGFGQFEHAVELCSVEPKQLTAIARAGGLIFNTYTEASDREDAENYPEEVKGLIPYARGKFKIVGNLDLYIP